MKRWHVNSVAYIYYTQALECRIAGVVPLDGSWTAECCIAVKQLLAGQTVTARPIEMVENGRIHVVDVQLPTGGLYDIIHVWKYDWDVFLKNLSKF